MATHDQRNEAFVQAALEVAGKSIFVDATKLPSRISELRRIRRFDLRVIHLVRDPRGYCHSARQRKQSPLPVLARIWAGVNQAAQRQLDALPAHTWRRVTYESLCATPASAFANLADFCGARGFVLPDNFRAFPHHIIGNRMRRSPDERTTVRLDEQWKSALSRGDLQSITRVVAPLARTYGYDM